MKIRNLLLACCLTTALPAVAETIVLKDGSSIQGTVVSMSGGQYQIQTQSMGTITLRQNQIRSISAGTTAPSPSQTPSASSVLDAQASSALQSMQSTMVNDPGIMSSIMTLQNDPDMQAVLQDPEIMQAIQNLDFQTLQNHPKMKKLMNNQKIRGITSKVQ